MNDKKCRDCKWLDLEQKTTVGYMCVNPNITHARLGYLKQKASPACKRGFEQKIDCCSETQEQLSDETGGETGMKNNPNLQETISLIETKLEDKSRILHWIHTGSLMDILTLLKEHEPKMGKWILNDDDANSWECSECGGLLIIIEGTPHENDWNFCPYCGAKLDKQEV